MPLVLLNGKLVGWGHEALERAKDRKNKPQEKIDNIRLGAALVRAMNRLRVSKK